MTKLLLAAVLLSAFPVVCTWDPEQRPPDAGPCACDIPDGGGWSPTVELSFSIDARGRPGFYADEDLEWKGSFTYDGGSRVLTYNASWAGPYAPLYDDGPWTAGGHEPRDSVANDDIFGITAFVQPSTQDVTIEYGAQTREGGWIWSGFNGSVTIPANATGSITALGLVLPPAGDVDLKLTIDSNNLAGGFTMNGPFQIKGTFSDWMTDPAYDDGSHGDDVAGDGVYTYVLSQAPHRLLPVSGTYEEFVWVDGNVEYKDTAGRANLQGVRVYARRPSDPAFVEVGPIFIAPNQSAGFTVP